MRFRLNKANIAALIGGEPLRHNGVTYRLPGGESDVKEVLRKLIQENAVPDKVSVFMDADTAKISIEINKES